MKKSTRIGLIICIITLGLSAITLAYLVWQTTPFFDMKLVLLEAAILLAMASLFVIAMMANPDRKG